MIGFIGLGLMGSAMARNLLRTTPLLVWNRTRSACDPLESAGASVARSATDVFERCGTVFVMLSDEAAIDAVLPRGDALRDRTLVLMSTVSPEYSAALGRRVTALGGAYVEAPVSGSRQPALDAALISLLAGDAEVLDRIEPHIRAMSSTVVRCGLPPAALTMKLAVNTFLITLVTGLAEAFHFAEAHGADAEVLRTVLDAGPMASAVSRSKTAKLVRGDWEAHAAIVDVLKNSRLVAGAARRAGCASPLMDVCAGLYEQTERLGHAEDDMAAVIAALRASAGSRHPDRRGAMSVAGERLPEERRRADG